jgi:hypothetical protein
VVKRNRDVWVECPAVHADDRLVGGSRDPDVAVAISGN